MIRENRFLFFVIILLGTVALPIFFGGCKKDNDNTNTPIIPPDSTVKDFDGNIYHKVKIGTQVWLVENLKVTHYRNGDPILSGNYKSGNKNISTEGIFWMYDNNSAIAAVYGLLYNWYAIADPRNISPSGWHIATDPEWTALEVTLGGSDVAGGKLKEQGTSHWDGPNTGASNESGFGALPNGAWDCTSTNFTLLGKFATFWTSTESGTYFAWGRSISASSASLYRGDSNRNMGWALRCVQDK